MRGFLYKVVIVFFLLSVVFSCGDAQKKEFDLAVSKGMQAYRDQQYQRALTFYKEALRIEPKNPDISAKVKEIEKLLKKQSDENSVQKLIQEAESLFEAGDYSSSKEKFREANLADPDNTYVQNKISEIENILLNQQGDIQESFPQADNPYHIIVGSFAVLDNAKKMQQKLNATGYSSIIIQRPNGFKAVSILRFQNIHDAFNRLDAEQEKFPDAWVLKY